MSRKSNTTAKTTSVYEMVTSRIIAQLEQGIIPWEKPWCAVQGKGTFNRVSKKPYSLLNQMLLKNTGEYASYKQWAQLGGHVKKGEKSEIVVFWKILHKTQEDEEGKQIKTTIPLLRYYSVFHISQVDGVEPLPETETELNDIQPVDHAEKLLTDYWTRENIRVNHVPGDNAFYSPLLDMITLPLRNQFINANEYYSTAFHESVHSTMAESRCNRVEERKEKQVAFGSDEYSKEELVAELGAASLMNTVNLETPKTFRNSAAYCQNWLNVLKNDVRFIVSASTKAEKAVEYILQPQVKEK